MPTRSKPLYRYKGYGQVMGRQRRRSRTVSPMLLRQLTRRLPLHQRLRHQVANYIARARNYVGIGRKRRRPKRRPRKLRLKK